MAELRSSTSVGGNLVWHSGNLRFDTQGDTIRYSGFKIYTENDTPLPSELGDGAGGSAYTKNESDARFAPIDGAGYVSKNGDTMSGKLTNTGNEIEITGVAPKLVFTETDTGKKWLCVSDGSSYSIRENDSNGIKLYINEFLINMNTPLLRFNNKTAFRGYDNWLRVNDQLEFTNGVYFGGSLVRTDGIFQVGNTSNNGLYADSVNSTFNWKGNRVFHDGYHPNADTWTTARTLTLGGDLTGSVSFNGSSNFTLNAQVVNDSHTHDSRYYTESESDARFVNVDGDTVTGRLTLTAEGVDPLNPPLLIQNTRGGGSDWVESSLIRLANYNPSIDFNDLSGSSIDDSVRLINVGNTFHIGRWPMAGTSSADFTPWISVTGSFLRYKGSDVFHDGYHPNADKWTTARTITLAGDVSGSVSINGSSNVTLNATVANDSHTHDGRYYTETEADSRFVNVTGDTMTGTLTAPIVNANGLITASSAALQVNGFMRTGNIYLHTGGNTPNNNRSSDWLSNDNGTLTWRSGEVFTANSYTTLDSRYINKAGDAMTGNLTVKELLFEGGQHRITNNDGGGNFNVRVGNSYNVSQGAPVATTNGTAFCQTWWNEGTNGNHVFLVSNAPATAGNPITFIEQMSYNRDWVRLGYQGSRRLYTSSSGIDVTGDVLATGNVTAYASDSRLKDIIEDIDPVRALASIVSMRKVKYKWNELAGDIGGFDRDKVEIGLLADKVSEDYPELTPPAPFDVDSNGESKSGEDYKTLQYERLVAVQAAAITALNDKVEQLQARIEKPWWKRLLGI